MKKVYILTLLALFTVTSFAQRKVNFANTVKSPKVMSLKGDSTLYPTSMNDTACGNHLTYYGLGGTSGYVTGTNKYGDLEKAQRFSGTGTISEVMVYVVTPTPSSTATTAVSLYSVNNTTLAPNASLGTSNTVALSAVNASGLTIYTFASPIAVSDKFYASYVLPTSDTAIVISTDMTICNSPDSCAWELWSPAPSTDWHSIVTSWSDGTTGLAIDLAIFPVLTTSANINDDYFIDGIKLGQNQPNPASINTLVQYELQNASNVSIKVYDMNGKLVMTKNEGYQSAGRHNVNLDSDKLSEGTYYYSLSTDKHRLTKKMVITK